MLRPTESYTKKYSLYSTVQYSTVQYSTVQFLYKHTYTIIEHTYIQAHFQSPSRHSILGVQSTYGFS